MSKNRVFDDPELTKRALKLLDAGYGETATARILGVARYSIQQLKLRRNIFGDDGAMCKGKRRTYSFEEKLEAVLYHLEGGHTINATCLHFRISSENVLKKWVKAYRLEGEDALRPAVRGPKPKSAELTREQQLEKQVQRLEAELAYLKAVAAWKKTK